MDAAASTERAQERRRGGSCAGGWLGSATSRGEGGKDGAMGGRRLVCWRRGVLTRRRCTTAYRFWLVACRRRGGQYHAASVVSLYARRDERPVIPP